MLENHVGRLTSLSTRNGLSVLESRQKKRFGLGILDILAFAAPLLRFVHIEGLGTLYLTELVLATTLFFQFFRTGRRLAVRPARTFILLVLVWLCAQVVTDLIRGSSSNDFVRGWAMIGFTLINFSALYLLLANQPKRIVLFSSGLALGVILEFFLAPGVHAPAYPWKFGYGIGVTWLLVLLAVALAKDQRRWIVPATVLAITAALNFYFDFRSAGGVAFLAACFIAAQRFGRGRTSIRLRPSQLLAIGIASLVGAFGSLTLYEKAAEAGWLGESARQKYEMQSGGEYGLFIGGRTEILVSSLAVTDSPVIGHGSWAKDCRYAAAYFELRRQAGYLLGGEEETCLIPTHSHLMGSWVQAGVVGAVVWSWVLLLVVHALLRIYAAPNRFSPLIAFAAFNLIWDIMFSPYAGFTRFVTPFYIVVVMGSLAELRNRGSRSHG